MRCNFVPRPRQQRRSLRSLCLFRVLFFVVGVVVVFSRLKTVHRHLSLLDSSSSSSLVLSLSLSLSLSGAARLKNRKMNDAFFLPGSFINNYSVTLKRNKISPCSFVHDGFHFDPVFKCLREARMGIEKTYK